MTIHYNNLTNKSIAARRRRDSGSYDNVKAVDNFTSSTSKYPFLYPTCYYYSVNITNKHWQLRNLLKFSSTNSNKVLYADERNIEALDLNTGEIETAFAGDFAPKCFSEKDGLVITGGLVNSDQTPGIVSLHNTKNSTSDTKMVGSVINNSVSINKFSNNQYNSYVCNNDRKLYRLDVSNSSICIINSINIGYQLNYSCLSNDQKMVLTSGDDMTISMVSPKANEIVHQIPVKTSPKDCGFTMDFHHSDIYFAAAFQSGRCFLYDVRNLKDSIHTFHSTRKSGTPEGAFRHLKFSNYSTDDYLFLTEHNGKVHVIDIRDFENHKVITLPSIYDNKHSRKFVDHNASNEDVDGKNVLLYKANREPSGNPVNHNFDCPIINDYHDLKYIKQIKSQKYYNASSRYVADHSRDQQPSLAANLDYSYISDYEDYYGSVYDILGMDWNTDHNGSKLAVGGKFGVTRWDIDSWSRRGFADFEFS